MRGTLLSPRLNTLCVVEVSIVNQREMSDASSFQPLQRTPCSSAIQGLQICRVQEASQRRDQETEDFTVPLASPAMWTVTSGKCHLDTDDCLTTEGFPESAAESSCEVAINPEWTGFLFVDHMYTFNGVFTVDGEHVPAHEGQLALHGMEPRQTLVLSWMYGSWKVCQVNALPPWKITVGNCYITQEGCFETQLVHERTYSDLFGCSGVDEYCDVEISPDWEGSLDVVDANFDQSQVFYAPQPSILTVNRKSHSVSSTEDLALTGAQGMVATSFSWRQQGGCAGLRLCPMDHTTLPGPWGDEPWTCTVRGENCTLPFTFNGVSFSACTQQLSDPDDTDQDGSLHNGHPQCQSAAGLSLCGPCSCAAGEEQTYNTSRVYPHTQTVALVTCAPCAAGRFKALGGSGTSDSCEVCPPGQSSLSGATACANCTPGMFNDYEMTECASCQPGFFGSDVGLTMCRECAVGRYTRIEQQTACDGCLEGSVLIAKHVGCAQCLPGTILSQSRTACSQCDAGRFQNTSGQSECYQCSAALNAEGLNSHLWTTMSRIENMEWREVSGSQSLRDCGCAAGAWFDALGQCHECGEGLTCKGMGEVEILPGYFASADSAGFVWRCHGADWARCPGGRPGTCAPQRLNTSTACEECEPYTRMTNDGPCKARCVLLHCRSPEILFFSVRDVSIDGKRKDRFCSPWNHSY